MPLQEVLTRRLQLQNPRFELENIGRGKESGSIISESFRGIRDSDRQRMIWDALHAEYGAESVHRAGTLLAFTPEEWNLDGDAEAENENAGGAPAGA